MDIRNSNGSRVECAARVHAGAAGRIMSKRTMMRRENTGQFLEDDLTRWRGDPCGPAPFVA
ncbi:MAG: hypothetical protein LBU17_00205 [Treponema sp.]|jgi:hypothetical protein|nr:hypothetical protein [Treponema sp.]